MSVTDLRDPRVRLYKEDPLTVDQCELRSVHDVEQRHPEICPRQCFSYVSYPGAFVAVVISTLVEP